MSAAQLFAVVLAAGLIVLGIALAAMADQWRAETGADARRLAVVLAACWLGVGLMLGAVL